MVLLCIWSPNLGIPGQRLELPTTEWWPSWYFICDFAVASVEHLWTNSDLMVLCSLVLQVGNLSKW